MTKGLKIEIPEGMVIKANLIALYKFVRKALKWRRQQIINNNMCKKKTIDQPAFTSRTISACVVGDYPGTANDLAGPVPDARELKEAVLNLWPDMTHRLFADSNATAKRLLSEIEEGSGYVGEDGMMFFITDTCHAESSTRNGRRARRRNPALRGIGYSRVLVFSAALSTQYASDASFPGGSNGAWHYALIKTLAKGITYLQWFNNAVALLKHMGFDQDPVIEGPMELQNRLVFEGNVVTIEISSHGGQVPDRDGDEPDGKDEVIYMYDGIVKDDEIRKILDKIDKRIFAKNKQILTRMKAKSFKRKDWTSDLPQTIISGIFLLFTVFVGFGLITSEQVAEATPLITSTVTAVSTVVTGLVALFGIFFKKDDPVV